MTWLGYGYDMVRTWLGHGMARSLKYGEALKVHHCKCHRSSIVLYTKRKQTKYAFF